MKPKVAFFDFASCEGCQLAVLNCEDVFLNILELVDIVEFREAMSETAPRFDVAFIEGSIHREQDVQRLQDIRARSTVLVAMGACACMGNVQARSNFIAPAQNFQWVYGEAERNSLQTDPEFWPLWAHTRVRAVKEIVAVDFELRGCPMVPEEFVHLVKSLVIGSTPHFPANAVCVECKMDENECVFDHGETCMGPITYGGCKAVCVTGGYRCDGCRGLLPHAHREAHRWLLKEKGLSDAHIDNRYRLFCSTQFQGREKP
ncbi:MAG: Oxidored q6 protein [Magnetococcales bacterium]|nr:Oxidored q6 protein [Magnetococcales bacterium]HIJ84821.1 NADH:ubiquinone oxidoreductase [Magnetococcales bacterium]